MTGVIRARLWLLIAGLALLGMAVMAFRGAQGTVVVSLTDAAGAVERPDAAVQEAETAVVSASGPVAAAGAEPALDGPSRTVPAPRILVHVAGAVAHPGLYELDLGARIAHAVEAAGGALPEADLDGVNLALPLRDGQQVFIPRRPPTSEPVGAVVPQARSAGVTPPGRVDASARLPEDDGEPDGGNQLVNINVAGIDELCALPGIGPALASRIVEYRQLNGPFQSVEQLLEVSGIGPSKLKQIAPLATVR